MSEITSRTRHRVLRIGSVDPFEHWAFNGQDAPDVPGIHFGMDGEMMSAGGWSPDELRALHRGPVADGTTDNTVWLQAVAAGLVDERVA